MDIDSIFKEIGEFGRYQWKIIISFGFANFPIAFQMIQNVFVGAIPEFYCRQSDGNTTLGCFNTSTLDDTRQGVCSEYTYGNAFTSTVSEWDLVCDKAYLNGLVQSVFMSGVLVGAITLGSLSDTYGRLKIFYIAMGIQFISALCCSFAPTYTMYIALRFFTGFSNGMTVVQFTLLLELVGAPWRAFCCVVVAATFAIGIAVYALMAYYIRNWRYLSVACAVSLVPFIHMYWLLFESPRWLLNKGKTSAAENILKRIAVKNGHSDVTIKLKIPEPSKEKGRNKRFSTLQLFTHKITRNRTLVQLYAWFVNSAVYYGLTLSSGDLGSNMYISVALSGLVEIPANIVAIFLLNRIGRKYSLCGAMLLGGLSCAAILFTPSEYTKTVVGLAMAGKLAISASFSMIYLYTSELYPTVVRNAGLGLCSTFARIGGILVPLIIPLGNIYPNLQFAIFGALSFTSGLLNFYLPETLGKPLPETFEDIDKAAYKITTHVLSEDTEGLLAGEGEDEMEEITAV